MWQVEHFFRDFKSPLNARPIYHRNASQVRGHLMGCFLWLAFRAAGIKPPPRVTPLPAHV
ncbi:MAG: hypothetical protein JRI25_11790 [Deltaproteobacteria bacterium]|nr:hypothetical protein [Deltaproteobacteria bacterium]